MKELAAVDESLFWYWISERHEIFLRRQRGEPKPWTRDPILRDYKFTNPFRQNDRGTVWLRENFLDPHRDDDLSLIAGNICWYRMFNWTGTGELLGWRTDWNEGEIIELLETEHAGGRQIFTGAHIVYSTPGFGKIEAITKVCTDLWNLREHVVVVARETKRLEAVFELLKTVHCVGGFMGYEMVTDMRHTLLLEDAIDVLTWANVGPGAERGLRRLGLPSKGRAALDSMCALLGRSRENLLEGFLALELRDIEHSLCEFDKWARIKFGEGKPRSLYPGAG